MLYEDDLVRLVVIADTEDDLIKRLSEWKDKVENRGMRGYDKWRIAEGKAKGCKMAMWCLG